MKKEESFVCGCFDNVQLVDGNSEATFPYEELIQSLYQILSY